MVICFDIHTLSVSFILGCVNKYDLGCLLLSWCLCVCVFVNKGTRASRKLTIPFLLFLDPSQTQLQPQSSRPSSPGPSGSTAMSKSCCSPPFPWEARSQGQITSQIQGRNTSRRRKGRSKTSRRKRSRRKRGSRRKERRQRRDWRPCLGCRQTHSPSSRLKFYLPTLFPSLPGCGKWRLHL